LLQLIAMGGSGLTGVELRVTILVTLGREGKEVGLDMDLGTEREIERGDDVGCEMGRGRMVVDWEMGVTLLVRERASLPASVKERDWGERGGSSGNIVMP